MLDTSSRAVLRLTAFTVAEKFAPPTWAVIRQIEIESDFDNNAVSDTGCIGMCQINPHFALQPGYGIAPCRDPRNPTASVTYLCDYLTQAHKHFAGLMGDAFLRYNVGMEGDLASASEAYKRLAAAVNSMT